MQATAIARRPAVFAGSAAALISVVAVATGAWLALGSGGSTPEPTPGAGAVLEAPVHAQVSTVELGQIRAAHVATGTLLPQRQVTIAAETGGRVRAVRFAVGEPVETDQVLVAIDDSRHRIALRQAQTARAAATADLQHARSTHARSLGLFEAGALSEADRDTANHGVSRLEAAVEVSAAQLQKAQRELADTAIRAPFHGVVAAKHVEEGALVGPGTPIATVVDVSTLRLVVGVPGARVASLSVGQSAEGFVDDLGGRPIALALTHIAPTANPATGLFDVELRTENTDGQLRGGMMARVSLPAAEPTRMPLVPRGAVVQRGGASHVFVLADNRATAVRVRTGEADSEHIEIVEGLEPGQQVVTSHIHMLVTGSQVVPAE